MVHTSKPSIRETEALGRPEQQDRELKACPRYTTKLRGKHQKQNKQNSSKTMRKIFKVNSSLHTNTMDSDIHEGHSCMCTRQRARTHTEKERERKREIIKVNPLKSAALWQCGGNEKAYPWMGREQSFSMLERTIRKVSGFLDEPNSVTKSALVISEKRSYFK